MKTAVSRKSYHLLATKKVFLSRLGAILAVLIGAMPLITTYPAPLADWPSHLARVWVIEQVWHGDTFWSAYYTYNGLLIPNAALDASILALQSAHIPFWLSATLTLLICYMMFIAGFIRLSSTFGMPVSLSPALSVGVFYTGSILLGLVNYVSGVGLVLLFFSWWIEEGSEVRSRMALALCATPIILFCHLVSGFLFAGICGVYDLSRQLGTKRLLSKPLRRLVHLIPAAVAFTICVLARRFSPSGTDGSGITFLAGYSSITPSNFISAKVRTIADGLSSGSIIADLIIVGLLFAVLILSSQSRCMWRQPQAYLALLMSILVFVAPFGVGEGNFLDSRLVLPAVAFAIIMLPWWKRLGQGKILTIYLLFTLRAVIVVIVWHSNASQYALVEDVVASIPPNSTLLAAYSDEPSFYKWRQPPLWNSASLAVFHHVFVPSMFAEPTQQPLAIRPGMRPNFFPAHYANARGPGKLAAVRQMAQQLCTTEPNTYLFVLHPSEVRPVDVEPICGK